MPDLQLLDCFQPELVNLERVRFFPRQLLTADDMVADQDYFRQKLRRHNRFLHGWGVVCGLEVSAAATQEIPWRVKIDAGYALGPYGDEIYVAEPVFLDLAKCGPGAATNPCEPSVLLTNVSVTGGELFIAIRYSECVAKPVRAMPAGCACEELACEYSRIRDSFQIECLTELPPSHQADPKRPTLCELIEGKQLAACPPCPPDPWIVLAKVPLPDSPATDIGVVKIDNVTVRRQIYSTGVLQEQLIVCCCNKEPQPEMEADLAITKRAVLENSIVRYVIKVTNNGPSDGQNVAVEDTLSANPEEAFQGFVDFSPLEIWSETSPTSVRAKLETLPSGTEQEIAFSIRTIRPDPTNNTIVNTATVTSSSVDPKEDNNTAKVITDLGPG
jgi:hypothetical protein